MREILFRGKDVGGNWHYGLLAILTCGAHGVEPGHYISNKVGLPFAFLVRPETVGQYTGLKDKNGVKIFEGDLPGGMWEYLAVGWCDECASFQLFTPSGDCMECLSDVSWKDFVIAIEYGGVEIIGNIHDNPEPLHE